MTGFIGDFLAALHAMVLALGPVIAPFVIYRALVLPRFPGRDAFVATFVAGVWWVGAAAGEVVSPDPAAKMVWAQLAWPGIMCAPGFWLLFVWSYIHSGRDRPPASWLIPLAAAPLAMTVLAFTNPWHHLVYVSAAPIGPERGAALDYVHGPAFFLAVAYIYLCLAVTTALIIRAAMISRGIYRRHYLAFLGAILAPWVFNLAYQFHAATVAGFDPTPFCLLFSGLVFFWLITRERLFTLTPIARGLLLGAVLDPILVLDQQGAVVELNPAAYRLPGLSVSQLGRALAHAPELEAALAPCLSEPPGAAPDIRLGDQDFEVRRTPLTYFDREVGQILVLRDITRRKAMEDELRAAKAEAEQALAAQQLMMREQRNFISMVGHEFRTPLSIIASAGQLLDLGDDGASELVKIRRAVGRMTQLIESCLADDRLDSAALLYRPSVADLSSLVGQDCFDAALRADGRVIRFEGAAQVETICDRTTLSVAVANLLDNALKYSPVDQPVEVTVQAQDGAAVIEVADRGPGVPETERQAVFEKFYRAVGTETAPGAGLGLYLVRRIVALHHGVVRVMDREGGGALFRIELPMGRGASA